MAPSQQKVEVKRDRLWTGHSNEYRHNSLRGTFQGRLPRTTNAMKSNMIYTLYIVLLVLLTHSSQRHTKEVHLLLVWAEK